MHQLKLYWLNMILILMLVMIMNLIAVAFIILFERKIMGIFHARKGPNKLSVFGITQSFSDALKLFMKEHFYPFKSNTYIYTMSPMLMFLLVMLMWLIYPLNSNLMNFSHNVLYFLALLSMTVYGLILSGWASNSNFSMLGAIRSLAQSISYEVTFSISMLIILMLINSMNFHTTYLLFNNFMFLFCLFPNFIFLLSILAEMNRTPFDLSESESELISGFNIEYGETKFILIFLTEYSSIMLMSMIYIMLFLPSTNSIYMFIKMILMFYLITWIRMTFPRLRYDKLMKLCWNYLLPQTLILFGNYFLPYKLFMDLKLMN